MVVAPASFVADELEGPDRLAALALPPLLEATVSLRCHSDASIKSLRIPLFLGVPATRPGWPLDAQHQLLSSVVERAELPLSPSDAQVASLGHAASVVAIASAVELIATGKADVVLAGGVDSYQHVDTLEWLDASRRLHSERNLDGFVPGEGAGFCLLASQRVVQRLKTPILARVRATAITREPHPFAGEGVCIGEGLTDAFHRVLANLADAERADWTLCDMNGESFRATEWAYAYVRSGRKHRDPLDIWHPADSYGDVGAASGAVLAAIAIGAWSRNYARGPRCLIWTSSDAGTRGALLLEAA
jgi:3-oxoacyl-[acyl-carrier-protein] synthase-1